MEFISVFTISTPRATTTVRSLSSYRGFSSAFSPGHLAIVKFIIPHLLARCEQGLAYQSFPFNFVRVCVCFDSVFEKERMNTLVLTIHSFPSRLTVSFWFLIVNSALRLIVIQSEVLFLSLQCILDKWSEANGRTGESHYLRLSTRFLILSNRRRRHIYFLSPNCWLPPHFLNSFFLSFLNVILEGGKKSTSKKIERKKKMSVFFFWHPN